MKILVLNCGSSSIKYKLYDMADESVLAQGGVERIGLDEAFIKVKLDNGEKKQIMADLPTHKEGVALVSRCFSTQSLAHLRASMRLMLLVIVSYRVATSLRRAAS